jgi:hypothetical protein
MTSIERRDDVQGGWVKALRTGLASIIIVLVLLTDNAAAYQVRSSNVLRCKFNSLDVEKGGRVDIPDSQIFLLKGVLLMSAGERLKKDDFLALSDVDLVNYKVERKDGYRYYLVRYTSAKSADEIAKSDLEASFKNDDGTLELYSFSLGADISKYNDVPVVVSLPSGFKLKRLVIYCESAQ